MFSRPLSKDTHFQLYLCGFTLLLYSFTLQFHHDSAMDYDIFELTRSLVTRGSLELDGIRHFLDFGLDPSNTGIAGTPGKDGGFFSPYGLLSLFLVPFYWVGDWISTLRSIDEFPFLICQFSAIFWGTVMAQLVFLICRTLGGSLALSMILALGCTCATPLWHQGVFINRDLPVGTLGLGAFYVLLNSRARMGWASALLSGILAGIGLLIKSIGVIYLAPLTLYLYFCTQKKTGKFLAIFWTPVLLGVFVHLLYNKIRFDSFFKLEEFARNSSLPTESTSVISNTTGLFDQPLISGIGGLLFSSGKGLLVFCPILLLLLFCSLRFYRSHRREWATLNLVFVSTLILYGKWHFWHAPGLYGPWFLTPMIPCLVVQFISVERAGSGIKTLASLLLLLSLSIQTFSVLAPYRDFYRHADLIFEQQGEQHSAKLQVLDSRYLTNPRYSPWLGLGFLLRNQLFANRFFPGFGEDLELSHNLYPLALISLLTLSVVLGIFSLFQPGLFRVFSLVPLVSWLLFFLWFCSWYSPKRLLPKARRDFLSARGFLEQGRAELAKYYFLRASHFDPQLKRQVEQELVRTLYLSGQNLFRSWRSEMGLASTWTQLAGEPPVVSSKGYFLFPGRSAIQSPEVSLLNAKIVKVGVAYRGLENARAEVMDVSENPLSAGHLEVLYMNQQSGSQRQLIGHFLPSKTFKTISVRLIPPPGAVSCAIRIITQGSSSLEFTQPFLSR